MSIKVMSYVWEHSTHKGSDLLLLLAIADHADDHGVAYPSIARLMQKIRMSERNVQYGLRHLQKSGELAVVTGAGPGGTHLYQIKLPGGGGAKFAPHDVFENDKSMTSELPDEKFAPINGKEQGNSNTSGRGGAKFAGGKGKGVQTLHPIFVENKGVTKRGGAKFAPGGVQPIAPKPSLKERSGKKEYPPPLRVFRLLSLFRIFQMLQRLHRLHTLRPPRGTVCVCNGFASFFLTIRKGKTSYVPRFSPTT